MNDHDYTNNHDNNNNEYKKHVIFQTIIVM